MSSFDEQLEKELEKLRKKKEEKDAARRAKSNEQKSNTKTFGEQLDEELKWFNKYGKNTGNDTGKYSDYTVATTDRTHGGKSGGFSVTDMALETMRSRYPTDDNEEAKWFKSGAFSDGYQFGDVSKTILGTVGDAGRNFMRGVSGTVEGLVDLGLYDIYHKSKTMELLAKKYEFLEIPDFIKDGDKEVTWKSLKNDAYVKATMDATTEAWGGSGDWLDQYSVLGSNPDALAEGLGQLALIWATSGLGSAAGLSATGVSAMTTGLTATSGVGRGMSEAYQGGATDEEAAVYGVISGAADAATEMIFSGMGKSIKAFGYGGGSLSSADDMLAKTVTSRIKNILAKNAVQFGIKAGAEGLEEVLAGFAQAIGKKATYMSEEDFWEIVKDENLFDQFIVAALTSSVAQSGDFVRSNKSGTDFITGYTQDDQAIFDKVVKDRIAEMEAEGKKVTAKDKATIETEVAEDLEKGFISTKTIEEVLGGDQYTEYQNTIQQENEALAELAQLYEGDELKLKTEEFLGNSKRSELEKALSDSVFDRVKNSKISESYLERARRTERFTADLTKYDEKQRAVVQKAIDSGVLNNTNRTRDMVDFIARVSADTGVSFDFTSNEKLKDTIYAVNGKTVDGYITKDGVVINVNSKKYINTVVGHEITHALEGTKLYEALESAVFEYAKANGTYKDVLKAAYDMYHGEDGYQGYDGLKKIKKEAVANMVGDYLFTDKNFISHLSAKNPNIFQKVWNEIKYMVKVARAGSDEAKKLIQVQKAFEEAYRNGGKTVAETKHSLSPVEAVQPKSDKWSRTHTTEEAMAKFPNMWNVAAEESEVRNPTQIVSTVNSYRKIYNFLQNEGFNGTILDASSGLGYGTKVGIEEYGFNVEDIEPYPDKSYNPKYQDYSTLDKKYDVIISNAVLNVLPQDQRDALVVKMGELLNDGGRIFVNVRGKDVESLAKTGKNIHLGNMEWIEIVKGSYQKGFTKPELVAYLQDSLGDGFTVEPTNMFGAVSAIVTKKGDAQYSLSKDSDGKQLTKEQQEYFKDSKIVDRNGNLLKVYHTTNSDFTVFDDSRKGSNTDADNSYLGHFFTDDPEYMAQFPEFKEGKTEAYYLNMKNPIDMSNISKQAFLDIVEVTGGDVQAAAELYDQEYEAEVQRAKNRGDNNTILELPRLLEELTGEYYFESDFHDVLRPNYDKLIAKGYDGIINNMDGAGWANEYIVLDSNQAKLTSNTKPTADPDIRFSLSKAVEETNDLVALHNLTADKLSKSLELGGLPMPSLAITKADIPHSNFGEITLIFGRETIDPKANKKNKAYSADAWTPTFPRVEYEADSKVANRVSQKLRELGGKVDDYFQRDLNRVSFGFEDYLNSDGGEEGLIQRVMDNYGMKAAYLEDSGKHIDKVTKQEEAKKDYNPDNADKYNKILDILGVSTADEIGNVNLKEARDNHEAELEAVYPGITKSAMRMGRVFGAVKSYLENKDNGPVYNTVTDGNAMQKAVDDSLDAEGYEAWVRNLFSGIVKDSGIYNNKEYYTPSGNRRSFKQTHLPFTLENIVKAMASQNDGNSKNVSGFNGIKTLRAATAETFKSVEEMHKRKSRLQNRTQEEADALNDALQTRLFKVIEAIDNESGLSGERNPYIRFDSIGETIAEIGESGKYSVADIQRVFKEYGRNVSDDTALEVKQLLYDVAQMPVNIFEAKPQRVVNFDEAKVFVIPNNANTKLKQELLNRGYSIAEYDPNVEGDRQKVVNQFEEYKFSLSNEDALPIKHGNYHVKGEDIAYEEMLPMAQAQTKAETPVVAPQIAQEPVEDMFPDMPVQQELENLRLQQQEILGGLESAVSMGDYGTMSALTTEYEDVTNRIRALEAQENAYEADRLNSIDEADAPPEMDSEHYEVADTTPLNKKTVTDLSRKVKNLLGIKNHRTGEVVSMIEAYSRSENPSSEQLFHEIKEKFGTYTEKTGDDTTKEVKALLRGYRINVSESIKSEIADYADLMRRNFGRVRFSKDGMNVDEVYEDLHDSYPGYFPESIDNPTNQLLHIIEVANMEAETVSEVALDDEAIMDAVSTIARTVNAYKRSQMEALSNRESKAAFDSLLKEADSLLPMAETPVKQKEVTAKAPVTTPPDAEIKTVKERLTAKLTGVETELANNRKLREESWTDFDGEIARAKAEYNAKSNKNTVAANDLLRRIERLNRMKHSADADFAKRISDLEAKASKVGEEIRTGNSPTEQGAMRQELHNRILSYIRSRFEASGFDFDTVLKNAKNLSTFATVDNTPQRVMEKALGYKQGKILSDITVDQVARNETDGIKWLNSFTDRKSGLLKQISKKYSIKPGSKESAAAQMYAEGFYVNGKNEIVQYGDAELALDFPDASVQKRIKDLARDPRIRQIYDETLAKINESRARNAYPEIPKLDNYFLHFRAMDDTFSRLGLPFNPNDIKAKDLPTDLNGVTADLKPGQPYFASAMHRTGKRTSFDLLGGLERYLSSAKNQIYHIDDIQTLRALRNYVADTYGQAKGLESLDLLTEEEAQERIKQVYGSHLSTFAKFLNEEANVIAGKTALIDRGLEGIIGRRGITFLDTVNQQVGKNMVGFNVSSSLTNFLAPVQAFAKTNKFDFVKAMAQTTANKVGSIFGKGDGFAESSPVMIRRKGAERFYRTPWQKAGDAGYVLMSAVDNISTELIARAKYNELTRKGMDSQTAHIETDKWVSRLMGDRSLGQQPQLYNSKMLGIVTKFQLEVRNQLDSQFYDTIQEEKVSNEHIQNGLLRNAKTAAKVTSTFFQLAVAQHLFGKAFESIAGYNPAFDIISVIAKMFGWDDEEDDEDTVLDNIEEGLLELLGDLPYTSTLTGGRIPISSALPIEEFVTGKDQYGNEKSRWETLGEALPYYLLPGGYGQIKKTKAGLDMFSDEHPVPGSYTDSGNLRFPVEDTPWKRVQAALFGQYASENARDYFDNDRQPLKPKQIQEYIDSQLPISDYWEYREGLSGLGTLDAKGDYIGGLDLPISTKNLFINNIAGRSEDIDMTNYHKYPNFSEFDWAEQNKEKYAFLQAHGMSYADYEKLDEDSKSAYSWAFNNPEKYAFIKGFGLSATDYYSLDDDSKDAYTWAYNNPESYTFSRSVTDDVVVYRQYARDLNAIKADKDEDGKSISGSRKDKVFDYIMGLDIDDGAKAILFKSEYPSEDSNNGLIIDYLNGRDDISAEEMVAILKKLGFTVDSEGYISW
jgi:hypothetical protein